MPSIWIIPLPDSQSNSWTCAFEYDLASYWTFIVRFWVKVMHIHKYQNVSINNDLHWLPFLNKFPHLSPTEWKKQER